MPETYEQRQQRKTQERQRITAESDDKKKQLGEEGIKARDFEEEKAAKAEADWERMKAEKERAEKK